MVHPLSARSGNALVAVVGIMTVVVSLILISATSASKIRETQSRNLRQTKALGALAVTMSRRESMLITMANDGSLARWSGDTIEAPNYGLDVVGECQVRWKIEPVHTVSKTDLSYLDEDMKYLANPNPDPNFVSTDANQTSNDNNFLYRVAAEAFFPGREGIEAPVIAQSVRVVAVQNEPLFRWVIRYLRRGPSGDLELSHDPAVSILGSVYSNGAVYMGSGTQVNDWAASSGGSGQTAIGSSSQPVKVNAVDGVFRLSKPTIYGALNGFPMANGPTITDTTNYYRLSSDYHPTDPAGLNVASFATATNGGRLINPYRVRDQTTPSLVTGGTVQRLINGTQILGQVSGALNPNDSRDAERAAALAFASTSGGSAPQGFNSYVRTGVTNAKIESIPSMFTNRALEPQQLEYRNTDGDGTTDEHDFAQPLFYATGANTTRDPVVAKAASASVNFASLKTDADLVGNEGLLVEVPGTYLAYNLGGLAMARLPDGTGWVITDQAGTPVVPTLNADAGLVIRERMVPACKIWPGNVASATQFIPYSSQSALPFALGKHWRPSLFPFTAVDVTENMTHNSGVSGSWNSIASSGGGNKGQDRNITVPSLRSLTYTQGGILKISSGTGLVSGDNTSSPGTVVSMNYPSLYATNLQQNVRRPAFYRDNWKFVHLRSRYGLTDTDILALPQGMRYTFWHDDARLPGYANATTGYNRPEDLNDDTSTTDGQIHSPYLGTPVVPSGIAADLTTVPPWTTTPTGVATVDSADRNYFSVRFEGFLVPSTAGSYEFRVTHDDGCRIWIDNSLAYEIGSNVTNNSIPNSFDLSATHPSQIVIQMYEVTGGHNFNLQWRLKGTSAYANIPAANLRAAPLQRGFPRSTFRSVVAHIPVSQLSGPTSQKVGLMIRPGNGEPSMLSGRDRYIALLYSPTRGFFTERRMEESREHLRYVPGDAWWIGAGSYSVNGGSVTTAVGGVVPTVQPYTYAAGSPPCTVTRTASLKCNAAPTPVTNDSTSDSISGSTTTVGPNSKSFSLGDGTTVTVLYGAYTKKRTSTRTITATRTRSFPAGSAVFTFTGATYPFSLVNTSRPRLQLFNDSATTTTTSIEYTLNANDYTVNAAGTTVTVNNYVLPTTSLSNTAQISAENTTVNGSTNPNSIWINGSWPSGYTGATFVAKLNASNFNGSNSWVLGNGTGNTPADPADLTNASLPLSAPAYPSPAAPTWPYDTGAHSFNISVSQQFRVRTDTNPWISGNCYWSAPMLLTRPWLAAWTSTFGLQPPLTGSLQPNLSYGVNAASPTPNTNAITEANTAYFPANQNATGGYNGRWRDDQPATLPVLSSYSDVWLRINHDTATGNITFDYAYGNLPNQPSSSSTTSWTALSTRDIKINNWDDSLMIGPCVQSGSKTSGTTVQFEDMAVESTTGLWNAAAWDGAGNALAGGATPTSRYLASQYQVFFGPFDITQDFFGYGDLTGTAPLATEDWIFNTREFWSQSPYWEYWHPTNQLWTKILKDAGANTYGAWANKQSWSKTTLLSLNLAAIWNYLRSRDIVQASTLAMEGNPVPTHNATLPYLADRFNGLLYSARTNRYPFNPNQTIDSVGAAPFSSGMNPWSWGTGTGQTYPNPATTVGNQFTLSPTNWTDGPTWPLPSSGVTTPISKLQPYSQVGVWPSRPQHFDHGVRLWNGANLNWGITSGVSTFGTGGTTFVTPNALYIHGNFNTSTNNVIYQGSSVAKVTPCAVMGDSVTLLSNAFSIGNYQTGGITGTSSSSYSGSGVLNLPTTYAASTTTYNMAIVTHNQPTTRARVMEGQSSPFIDTMLFMENWNGQTMNFTGSLVVLDTRRYTDAFLLDVPKTYGRSPFGYMGWVATTSLANGGQGLGAPEWTGTVPIVYRAGTRNFNFQTDFLLPGGTPPFTPFGSSVSGLGSWTKVVR